MNSSNHTPSAAEVKLFLKDDEWKRIQQNTFTRWVNQHLKKAPGSPKVENLATDFHDGLLLIQLAEVLAQRSLTRFNRKPTMRTQKLDNISTVLNFFQKEEHIKIVNIDSSHIADHNLKLILGLVWTLILHYSLSQPIVSESGGADEDVPSSGHSSPRKSVSSSYASEQPQQQQQQQSPKKRLLAWVQERVPPHLSVTNFTSDWTNGIVLGALVNACLGSDAFAEWRQWTEDGNDALLYTHRAMQAAEDGLGVAKLITPEELTNPNVDEKSVMTYLSQFPRAHPLLPIGPSLVIVDMDTSQQEQQRPHSETPTESVDGLGEDECQHHVLPTTPAEDDDDDGAATVATTVTRVTKTTTSYTIAHPAETDEDSIGPPSVTTDMDTSQKLSHYLVDSNSNGGMATEPTTVFEAVHSTHRREELFYQPLEMPEELEPFMLAGAVARPRPGSRLLCRERSNDHIEAAAMVGVEGHGLQGFVPGQQANFTVDASKTGFSCPKALFVGVVTSRGPADKVTVEHVGGGRYEVAYTVQDDVDALVFVKYGKNNVDGSPFSVRPMSEAFIAEVKTDDDEYYRM